jgi:hypothetical protein
MNNKDYIAMNKETILISFSGGRTSAFMTKWILESEKYKDFDKVVIFANTGKEREETLEFVDRCDKEWDLNVVWVEAKAIHIKGKGVTFKLVDFETASRNGEPFEDVIKKKGFFPNQNAPFCSEMMKTIPINKFMKTICKDYYSAIGIRADETQRVNWENAKKKKYIYPLITDFRVDESYIRTFWSNQCFDLKLKDYEGNCDNCYKKSIRKLMTLAIENPTSFDWWAEMEKRYGDINDKAPNQVFYRNELSAIDIVEMAKTSKFNKAKDKFEVDSLQFNMFNLDEEKSCFCK